MEKLFNALSEQGKYTKSFEDFQTQFGSKEGQEKLYGALKSSGDYTKSFGDFSNQFFVAEPVKTNDSASADPAVESSQEDTGSKSEDGSSESAQEDKGFLAELKSYGEIGNKIYELTGGPAAFITKTLTDGGKKAVKFLSGAVDNIQERIIDEPVEAPTDASSEYLMGRGFASNPSGFFESAYDGIPGAANTTINLLYGNMKDIEEASAIIGAGLYLQAKKGEFNLSSEERIVLANAVKSAIKVKDSIIDKKNKELLESVGMSGISPYIYASRENLQEIENKLLKNQKQYDTAISEEILKGTNADWAEIGGRTLGGALTSAPYSLMSMNPYSAAYMGVGIAADKFVEEIDENPDRAFWKLSGAAATTGGIEMADAWVSRRLLRSKGFLPKGKGAEKAVEQMNRGIGRKLLDIIGIGAKEGGTETAQAIGTKISDYLWLDELPGQDKDGNVTKKGLLKTAYEIVDEGIIGAFTGGGMASIGSVVQGNDALSERAKFLLTPEYIKDDRKKLYDEYIDRAAKIKEARESGNNRRAGALQDINDRLGIKINKLDITSTLVLDNLTQEELTEYARNVDKINALLDGKVDNALQNDAQALQDQNNDIFDKALKRNFGENMSFAQAAATQVGLTTTVVDNAADFNTLIKDPKTGKFITNKDGVAGAFVGGGQLIINKEIALQQGDVTVGSHEILHPILNAMIGDINQQMPIVEDFKKQLNSREKKWVENELKRKGKKKGTAEYYGEYLTVYSEGLANKNINFDNTTFENLKEFFTRLYKGKGFDNIDFKTGRGVYNFMSAYGKSVQEGKLSEDVLSAIDAEKVATVEAVDDTQFSKTLSEDVKTTLSDNITEIKNLAKENAAIAAKFGKEPIKGAKQVRLEREVIEGVKPLVEKIVTNRTKALYDKIADDAKRGVTREQFQESMRADIETMILNEYDATKQDLEKFAVSRAYLRANDLAKRLGIESIEEGGIKKDIDTAKDIIEETTTTTKPKEPSVERGQATFDELDIVDDALIADIEKDLNKEIRTRVQKGTLSEKISVKKGRDTYLVTWLEDYVNKQLFKKLSKKLGAIGERNGETVIPGAYIDFLNDPKTFGIITKALPIKSIKKSYSKLFPIEKIGRELTAEGNPIFRIKKIDKKAFLTYFVEGKKTTILERQKQLFREILEPLAKQVVANYATPENLANLKEVQELAPDASLDAQADIIIEAQLNNLQSQLDRYKGEKTGFDIIQFSKTVTQEQKQNISNALKPLLEKPSTNDFQIAVVEDIINGLSKVENFKDLAKLVWNAGNDTLNKNGVRKYRAEILKLLANKLNYTNTVKFLISAINKHQTVYKYQQKVIGFDYSLANFKSSLNDVSGIEAKANVAELFLRYISRSIRTLKLDGITKNSQVYDQILKPVLGDPKKYGFSLEIDKEKNRSYILKDGVRLQGLADVTNIKADFINNVKTINEEAAEVRNWLLGEAIKAKFNKNGDFFISFLSLISADQRGVIRKMNSAGFAMEGLLVKDSILEHETEAFEVFKAWKDFLEGKLKQAELTNFLEGAKVNLISRELDALLRKVQKEKGWRGKKRYTDQRVIDFLANKKIIQFSKSNKDFDKFGMADIISRQMFPNAFVNKPSYAQGYDYLTPKQQAAVKAEMKNANLIQFSKTLNKAKAMINRPDAPVKGISVWDFDDTLATTKSNVLYTMPNGTKGKIDATEFALNSDTLAAQGAEFDFSEFSKVMEGAKGPMFEKAIARNKKFGNDNVYILTARPANSKYAIHEFLKGIGLDIKLENIFGLGDGTALAKAQWVVGKVAEGYNDFYFADDAYKNVKAVQEVLEEADVKSKVHQAKVQFSKNLSKEFNNIIEDITGIESFKTFSEAKGKVRGQGKGKYKFFIPPSADDFAGLLYKLTGKGKTGEAQQAWFKEALFDPFAKAMREFESYKQNVTGIVNQLKKDIKNVPSGLKKVNETGFTNEVAVRVYLWAKNGYDINGLSETDKKELIAIVQANQDLLDFADQMDSVLEGYPEPQNDWLAGTITTDAINMINTVKRAEFLEAWQNNADAIFTKENFNKLRAAFGDNYVEAMEDMLYRMKTGRNRPSGANKLTNRFMNWVNDSVGTIMFFNTRSALLQTLSIVNFINWGDNNPMAAAKAFANQKQFWSDFAMLFNSDFLKQRRSGLKNDVNADDIANAAETATNKTKAALSSILKMGFLPTQIADSFAIAVGGASFVRNRINKYISEGMDAKTAEEQAFLDFQEIAEETQQSSRPDRVSQQQASPLGRIILAFANTPMQYMRLTKKAFLDLKNGRGDAKTNITKIAYYMAVQNIIFSSLQAALFASLFDDDEEALDNKQTRVANSMLDSILRGVGVYGAIASTLKNIIIEIKTQAEKDRPDFTVAAQRSLSISPPIDSKMRKLMGAGRAFSYKTTREKMVGFGLDNPAFYAGGQIVSALTNVPLDRAIRKADNLRVAVDNDTKYWQSIALLLGYSQWDLGLVESSKSSERSKSKKKSPFGSTIKYKPSRLTKKDFIKMKNKK